MKAKVRVYVEGKYAKTVKYTPAKINLGKVLINKLTKEANILRNKRMLSLQK